MDYEPLNRFAIIKPLEAEKERSGLIINREGQKKVIEGEVIAVSETNIAENGKELPISIKVGDIVLYSRFGGEETDDGEFKVLEINQIMARKK